MANTSATKTWRVLSLEAGVGEPEALVRERVCRDLGLDPAVLRGFRIVKKSLDARWRGEVRRLRFVIHADLVLDADSKSASLSRAVRSGRVIEAPARVEPRVAVVHATLCAAAKPRIAVVGAGPGGLFAALVLARHGLDVTLVDRGAPLERRSRDLTAFHRTRRPNPESNLLFGEGGAGTYSDGKLYTRVDDPLEVPLLEELVACGAPADILFDSRAHIGTDRLHRILPAFRRRLEAEGVRFVWNTRVDALVLAPGPTRRVRAVATSSGEIACEALVLAPGHSARDTWSALYEQGVVFEARPFQLGVRVEHPQELVDLGRHGAGPEAESLGAASYQLVCREGDGLPSAHTFCMCPGGRIVASVNEAEYLCTNGMSNSRHSSPYANAAIVTTIGPREFGEGPFAGVAYQREIEKRFFEAGGGDYTAPAQRADDFVAGRETKIAGSTSYAFGTLPARIDRLLPERSTAALRRALARFDRSIPGYAGERGWLVGIESRSSGPVRMPRDADTRRARGFVNLYPVGEGAGYAGGIMSAALDGAHSVLVLLRHGIDA
jgi:uncharacterized FAD-dependent dehydrogenase